MNNDEPRNDEGLNEDQLWASLDGQTGTERASTLLDLCAMVNLRAEFEQALSLGDTAVEVATEADNEQVAAHAHMMRGVVLRNLERSEESAAAYLDAAHIYERFDSAFEIAQAYFETSWSLEMAGILDRALECADTAIASASQQTDSNIIAKSHHQRADVLQKLGDRGDEVLQELAAARQAYRDGADVASVLALDDRVAGIFADTGEHEAAVNLLRDCLAVAESLNEERAAYFSYRLARTLRMKGDFAEALKVLQAPLAFNLANDDIQPLGATYFEMAVCEWRLDHDEEAFRLIAKARAHFDMVGFDRGVIDADEQRAMWLHGMGRYPEAVQVNKLLVEVSTDWIRFMARARLADNYRFIGDLENALLNSGPEADEGDEYIGAGGWFWRECVRALTLERMERFEEAWAIARVCLGMDLSNASAFVQAKFHELRGDSTMDTDHEDVTHADWARAVAFYLVADLPGDAKRLSAEFLPSTGEDEAQ